MTIIAPSISAPLPRHLGHVFVPMWGEMWGSLLLLLMPLPAASIIIPNFYRRREFIKSDRCATALRSELRRRLHRESASTTKTGLGTPWYPLSGYGWDAAAFPASKEGDVYVHNKTQLGE